MNHVRSASSSASKLSDKRQAMPSPQHHDDNECDGAESIEEMKARARQMRKKSSRAHSSRRNPKTRKEDEPESVDKLKAKARRQRKKTSDKGPPHKGNGGRGRFSSSRGGSNEADSIENLKLKARALRKKASDKSSLDQVDWIHGMSSRGPGIEKLEAKAKSLKRSDSDTSLLLEEIFDADKGTPHIPESEPLEKRFSESFSGSLSSISRYFDSVASIKDDENPKGDKDTPPTPDGRRIRSLLSTGRKSSDRIKPSESLVGDESESVASGSIVSSISRYFDSVTTVSKDEDVLKIRDALSIERTDKRHLLLIGQKPSEQTKAEILLNDKQEWRKLQQRIRQSGMITNEGTRQILNPLLEKAKIHVTHDDSKELPPFIMFPEPSAKASEAGRRRLKK